MQPIAKTTGFNNCKTRQLRARRSHRSQNHFLAEVQEALNYTGYHLREAGHHLRLAVSPDFRGPSAPADPTVLVMVADGDLSNDWAEAQVAEFEARQANAADFEYPVLDRKAA